MLNLLRDVFASFQRHEVSYLIIGIQDSSVPTSV
jgi:hypothetical protein